MRAAAQPGGRRLQDRIVLFFVVLLLSVQLVSFVAIRFAIDRTARDTLREELRVDVRVFQRILQQNTQRLVDSAVVLTADFGFRAAVASNDRETLISVLTNHAGRIKASGMSLIGLDGIVIADIGAREREGKPYAAPRLVELADSVGYASGLRSVGDTPIQSVVVPVLAPVAIAWVSMEFVLDDRAARDLKTISSADVSFVRAAGQGVQVLATTLPASRRAGLQKEAREVIAFGSDGIRVEMGDEEYEALAMALEGNGRDALYAVLQRPVSDGIAPYIALQAALLVIAGFSLAITFAGAVRIARRITRPVAQLAEAAREIEKGNYDVRVAAGTDEIGELAHAFDGMARGLAERDRMRDVLGKVASSDVVAQLMESRIELGGAEVEATVMFTDMRNFTGIAESLAPQQSLLLLNRVLTEVSEVIESHGGVVDKYLGDGAMGVFGAPVTRPDDPQRAVEAALEIRRRIAALAPELAALGLPGAQVGIGLNTARMVAGNIGSPRRLNYTVLGDGVNLASRLEGLTKRYHVPIVAGSRTRASVQGIVWRELDNVRVRGKTVPERIYEPLGREGEIPPVQLVHAAVWHEALETYRARKWSLTRALLEQLADEPGYMRLVSIYNGYLREALASPPGADWDGAFTLYEK